VRRFWKPIVKFLAWVVGLLLVFVAVMRIFFVDAAVVGHNGMAPNLEVGDEILLWRHGTPDTLGDVTICPHPGRPNELVVGRVLAKGGMTIQTDPRGQLVVEGSVPDRNWVGEMRFTDVLEQRTEVMRRAIENLGAVDYEIIQRQDAVFTVRPVAVPEGKIFLLGDNRTFVGQDSRYFGPVDPATCVGTVFMRLWPASESPNDLGHGFFDIID